MINKVTVIFRVIMFCSFLAALVFFAIGSIRESAFTGVLGLLLLFKDKFNEIGQSITHSLFRETNIIAEFKSALEKDLSQAEYERIVKKVIDSTYSWKTKYNFLAALVKDNPFPEVKSYAGIKLAELTDYTDKHAIDGLLITISDNKFHRRANTILKSLHKYGKHVEQPLIDMLDHNWRHAREHAAIALGNLKSQKAISKLIERLNILNDHGVHHFIIDSLVKIDSQDSIELVRKHLNSETTETVLSALKAVAHFQDKDAIEGVFELLNHDYPDIQKQALETALVFGDETLARFETYVNKLIESKVQQSNNDFRIQSTLRAIGEKISNDNAVDFLAKYLQHDDPDVRLGALVALGLTDNKSAIPYLEKHCQDSHFGNQALSAFYIGEIGSMESDKYIIPLLEHEAGVVRYFSAYALGKLKSTESVGKLILLLEDHDYISTSYPVSTHGEICNVTANSLEAIGTPEALEAVNEWRNSQSVDG